MLINFNRRAKEAAAYRAKRRKAKALDALAKLTKKASIDDQEVEEELKKLEKEVKKKAEKVNGLVETTTEASQEAPMKTESEILTEPNEETEQLDEKTQDENEKQSTGSGEELSTGVKKLVNNTLDEKEENAE